jgi:hypothetical protein
MAQLVEQNVPLLDEQQCFELFEAQCLCRFGRVSGGPF